MAKGKFLDVKCKCGEQASVYSHSTTPVFCLECNEKLLEPTGGKAAVLAEELETTKEES